MWMCLCVGVFVCIWGKRRRWGEKKLLSLLSTEKREKKKRSKREINKIINGRATVTVYIYTITVTRVEIYTFLHNFRSTDVEHFLGKMCKSCVFLYFIWFCIHWCGCFYKIGYSSTNPCLQNKLIHFFLYIKKENYDTRPKKKKLIARTKHVWRGCSYIIIYYFPRAL